MASTSGTRLRKALVVLQFVVSVALIATTFGIQAQLRFIRTKQLGLEQERLVVVPIRDTQVAAQPFAFKEAVLDQAYVARVSISSSVPLRGFGFNMPVSSLQVDDVPVTLYTVDPDFVVTYGLEMAEGHAFSEVATADASWVGVLNETAAQRLQMDDHGEQMVYLLGRRQIEVVGIVKDFHYQSLHQEVGPLLLQPLGERHRQTMTNYVSVKLRPGDPAAALDVLEVVWHRFAPDEPFQYFFLDQAFDQLYKSEERLARMFNAFTMLAILIGCLGLFGLAAYTTQQRTKELSIRKVVGASVWQLILLLLQDVVKLIGLAFGIAVPLAYMGLERWLQDFAYRVSPGIALFALAGGLALGIALLTVGYQTVRAALTNPVEALRYE